MDITSNLFYLCGVIKCDVMPKEKKITVKPFLNHRVGPERLRVEPDGIPFEADFYPMYYQIIYDRNNTNLAAASIFGGARKPYLFHSLEDNAREFYTNRPAREIIKRDSKLIEMIIRYEVSNTKSFELKGIKESFIKYEKNLFREINIMCKQFLIDRQSERYNKRWSLLFDVESEDLSFNYIFTTFQKLFNVFDVYSAAEIQHLQHLKIFFEAYQQKHEAHFIPSWANPDNVLGAVHDQNHYSIIQWYSHEMLDEFTWILREKQFKSEAIAEIRSSVDWILDYGTRMRSIDLSNGFL